MAINPERINLFNPTNADTFAGTADIEWVRFRTQLLDLDRMDYPVGALPAAWTDAQNIGNAQMVSTAGLGWPENEKSLKAWTTGGSSTAKVVADGLMTTGVDDQFSFEFSVDLQQLAGTNFVVVECGNGNTRLSVKFQVGKIFVFSKQEHAPPGDYTKIYDTVSSPTPFAPGIYRFRFLVFAYTEAGAKVMAVYWTKYDAIEPNIKLRWPPSLVRMITIDPIIRCDMPITYDHFGGSVPGTVGTIVLRAFGTGVTNITTHLDHVKTYPDLISPDTEAFGEQTFDHYEAHTYDIQGTVPAPGAASQNGADIPSETITTFGLVGLAPGRTTYVRMLVVKGDGSYSVSDEEEITLYKPNYAWLFTLARGFASIKSNLFGVAKIEGGERSFLFAKASLFGKAQQWLFSIIRGEGKTSSWLWAKAIDLGVAHAWLWALTPEQRKNNSWIFGMIYARREAWLFGRPVIEGSAPSWIFMNSVRFGSRSTWLYCNISGPSNIPQNVLQMIALNQWCQQMYGDINS